MTLTDELLDEIKQKIKEGEFPKLNLRDAILYVESGGLVSDESIPMDTWFHYDDFLQKWGQQHVPSGPLYFSATDLKNKTGLILLKVTQGHKVAIQRHGRIIAMISTVNDS